ncbi:mismatch-specific DNA-glycosylase (plasmid) [Rhizobium leguminosarum]|uniref:Mismatch-specific DNA-glycosylase n=1 Tax=Rhizobium leguminosarum TaxID=384 RepID=A0A444IFI3_RHILE|nr:mismatch-specific DNA-glycosylase [Rhizobium leguminosarum]ASS59201.1 mismatch-specific DNA-glycosylase [Rhizobium leguminosarum bv. viciae]MBB4330591.1 TDG/mug DNA glycosylase family protein [Rhizobium leguminosarum]MBB4344946.1 TDG/mug DNA glycosylase family protein [Rhizobium leguminosarum]MBB4355771.1 TDG/mug DNA glycosylase family protein [Rhizobium leguminosarum]MBB4385233.1 TDG/mug DNA glycosylase family protein [Rhizobium leguminosarum]
MQDDAASADLDGPDASTMPKAGLSEILVPGLSAVFCGLNPALSAVRDGHNFSNPSNRFWRVLLLQADEERELLQYGCGLTSAVSRPTKSASELKRQDYLSAAPVLENKTRKFAPANLAFLGKAAYAGISLRADVEWGRQPETFAGAAVWLLPNPSGLNRAFTLTTLTEHYLELRLTL